MPSVTGLATNVFVRGTQYKKNCYKWNGRNLPRCVDGETWSMAGIRRHRFIPVVAAGAAGTPAGVYYYYLVPTNEKKIVMNANGRARPTQGIPSFRSKAVTLASQIGSISAIPTHPDPQVTHWYVYRNRNGEIDTNLEDETQDYFYVGKVANGTTTFSDNFADSDMLGADQILFNLNTPPCFVTGDIFAERLFGGDFEAFTATATKNEKTVNNKLKTDGVVTLQTSAAHGYSAGTWITVSIGDARFDGGHYILSVPTTTTFTYALPGSDVSTVAASGTSQNISFSAAQHDGIIGCWLQASGSSEAYRIVGEHTVSGSIPNGTSITAVAVDRLVSGTLSATTVTIYRDQGDLYGSEFMNFENWGPDSEGSRWVRTIPGKEPLRLFVAFGGRGLVCTPDNIYAIDSVGPGWTGITMSKEPIFRGVGCVGADASCMVDDDLFICTKRGPHRITQGWQLENIGKNLNTDWLDSLTDAERKLIVMSTDGQRVWIDYPVSGGTANSETWCYDRKNQAGWWAERGRFVSGRFKDKGLAYYFQSEWIWKANSGTYDGTSANYTGTVSGAGATTITGSGFPTASNGLEDCVVHLFNAADVYQGLRRIASNTSTVLTLDAGSPTPVDGWTYVIGNPVWRAKSKTQEVATKAQRTIQMEVKYDAFGSSQKATRTDIKNGSVDAAVQEQTADEPIKYFDVNAKCWDYAVRMESKTLARIRHVLLKNFGEDAKK